VVVVVVVVGGGAGRGGWSKILGRSLTIQREIWGFWNTFSYNILIKTDKIIQEAPHMVVQLYGVLSLMEFFWSLCFKSLLFPVRFIPAMYNIDPGLDMVHFSKIFFSKNSKNLCHFSKSSKNLCHFSKSSKFFRKVRKIFEKKLLHKF
jgi:hypothetical protein